VHHLLVADGEQDTIVGALHELHVRLEVLLYLTEHERLAGSHTAGCLRLLDVVTAMVERLNLDETPPEAAPPSEPGKGVL
jgi:hypothetical protein